MIGGIIPHVLCYLFVYFLSPGSESNQSFIGLATCDSGLGKTLNYNIFLYLIVIIQILNFK